MNVVGPAASDGPSFVAVTTTVPEVPGVIVGDDTDTATSADGVPTTTEVGATVLFVVDGSVVVVEAEAEPPEIVPGEADAGTDTGTGTDARAPLARLPATVHVTVPEAKVQPDGNVPPEAGTVTPDGGV